MAARRMPRALASALLLTAACRGAAPPDAPRRVRAGELDGLVATHDLVALLPSLEQRRERAALDLGEPAAREQLLDGWLQDERDGQGRTFLWATGTRASLWLYLGERRGVVVTLRCWPLLFPGAPAQEVTPSVNGVALPPFRLRRGEEEYSVALPAEAVVEGENLLELRFAWSRRPGDVVPGSRDSRELAVCFDEIRIAGCAEGAAARAEPGGRLVLPAPGRLDAYVALAPGSRLALDGISGSGALRVELQEEGEAGRTVAREAGPGALDLGVASPVVARLSLVATGARGAEVVLEGPRIAVPPGAVADDFERSAPVAAVPSGEGAARPDVLLYVIDALRADHLGAYGSPEMASPFLDALSRGAALHEEAFAHASWTRPSSVTLLTGLRPAAHGVVNREAAIPESVPTLPQLLGPAGYRTAVIVTNTHLAAAFGFDRGCDLYEQLRETAEVRVHQPASSMHARYFAWRDGGGAGAPAFAMLHATDVHAPYVPGAPFRDLLAPGLDAAELGNSVRVLALKERGGVAAGEAALLERLYDAELLGLDADFGTLRAGLVRRGAWARTLLVVTGDHGEAFGERGLLEHGDTLYQEVLQVPLLVMRPGVQGSLERALARHEDVVPTILAELGLARPAPLRGRDLATPASRLSTVSSLDWGLVGLASLATERWQIVRMDRHPRGGRRWELFDLAVDPGARQDVVRAHPVMRGFLAAELRREESVEAPADGVEVELDPEVRRTLEALGYVD